MLTDNPIWFREQRAHLTRITRQPVLGRLRRISLVGIWGVITGIIFCLGMCTMGRHHSLTVRDLQHTGLASAIVACYVQLAYVMFRALISGAVAFTRERELQTMDTILASPLPLRTLLLGKWKVAVWPLLSEVTWALPLALLYSLPHEAYGPYLTPERALGFYLLNVAVVLLFSAIGLLVSSRAENSGRASMQAVLVGITMALGTYIIDVVLNTFLNTDKMMPVMEWLNPFSALWGLVGSEPQTHDPINACFWVVTSALYVLATPFVASMALHRLKKSV